MKKLNGAEKSKAWLTWLDSDAGKASFMTQPEDQQELISRLEEAFLAGIEATEYEPRTWWVVVDENGYPSTSLVSSEEDAIRQHEPYSMRPYKLIKVQEVED